MDFPDNIADAGLLAQAIINTIVEPFLVLDDRFYVLGASKSFYSTFGVDPDQTSGQLLYSLGNGQWDIPALRTLLESVIPQHSAIDGFEVAHEFPGLGWRIMHLSARSVQYGENVTRKILIAFNDITARRAHEQERQELLDRAEDLLAQKNILLQEMEHRVGNSLQIIASILMMKARAVTSAETRLHLQDAHRRVLSVAEVQSHLHAADGIDQIEVGSYLRKLCQSLGETMIGENQPIELTLHTDEARVASGKAMSLGLIITELVMNAIKYAFPDGKMGAEVVISYETDDADWKLTVSDNGIGKPMPLGEGVGGLGTIIVGALARQLDARLETQSNADGTTVSITRATFTSKPSAGRKLQTQSTASPA